MAGMENADAEGAPSLSLDKHHAHAAWHGRFQLQAPGSPCKRDFAGCQRPLAPCMRQTGYAGTLGLLGAGFYQEPVGLGG